jgi:hypothetical protein
MLEERRLTLTRESCSSRSRLASFIGDLVRWIVGSPVLQSALTTLVVVVVPLPLLLALLFPFAVDSRVYREHDGNPVDG